MAQRGSNTFLYGGIALASGVGYYLYSAGGSPKVAEKQFESDMAKASAKMKSELPGRTTQVQKESEKWASEAGSKVDSAVNRSKAELEKTEAKFEQMRKDAANAAMKKIDAADKTIEVKASQAKSGISSWFGGK